ncbi:MAG TPA: glycoside hydrolase family 13 protein [Marmoricola sp.]|nr:glycoside hydrolase family 13 protein [Marmoricola sp.]
METGPVDLRDEPHHDGSPLYLDDEAPALGSHVGVRVRTSTAQPTDAVWVRTVEDGEPFYEQCTVETVETVQTEETETVWWRGRVHVRNPVERYRFLVVRGDSFRWLNAAGVWDHDVTDAHDFTVSVYDAPPAWGRDAVVYQVFPDRFARSAAAAERPLPDWASPAAWHDDPIHEGPLTPLQLYGGDLDGITEHLDHVAEVGADTLYLTPVFPAESNHRYNASTFDEVDPLLGGDAAYRRLVDATHGRGWRILGDLTSNHTGDTHEWFRRAQVDPGSVERGFYFFDENGGHEGWKGHGTLPKLDHTDPALGERFRAVVARWLDFGLDGWRIDVANMTGRHEEVDIARDVAREIRRVSESHAVDPLVLAEHGHDATGDLPGDGWHGTMNYYGFSFPVWEWLHRTDRPVPSFGWPVDLPVRTGPQAFTAMRAFLASFGWRAVTASWNILGSHDTPRIRTVTGTADRQHAAAVLQFCLPGVPMVFAGDELGLEGTDGEDSRRTMPWAERAHWDTRTMAVYRRLADLRAGHPALRRGGLRWLRIEDDEVLFVREHPAGDVLVSVHRSGTPTDPDHPEAEELLHLAGDAGARIWLLPRRDVRS